MLCDEVARRERDIRALLAECSEMRRSIQALDTTMAMFAPRLDPAADGTVHAITGRYLYANNVRLSEVVVLSTADKGAIVRANDHPGWLDWVQSLQEVLNEAGITGKKVEALGRQHTSAFLSKVRTDVRNGVIP